MKISSKSFRFLLMVTAAVMIVLSVFAVMKNVSFLFTLVVLIWVAQLAYTVCDLQNRSGYLIFLLVFFVFLLAGEFFELYFGYSQEFSFSNKLDTHAYICLLISLLGLFGGFVITGWVASKAKQPVKLSHHVLLQLDKMRRITLAGMAITVLPWFITAIEASIYSINHGYLSYYTDFHSQLPEVIESLSDVFPVFFFFFLATMPSKKETAVALLVYVAHGTLMLLIGRRLMFGVALLVSLFYLIYRHYASREERWINKRFVIMMLIACPLIIVGLYVLRYVRYGQQIEESNGVLDLIFKFLSQQGSGIHPIKLQKQLEGDNLGCTSLYYTLHYLRGNMVTRGFFDFPMDYYAQRSMETALHTNCLADYIMYRVNANDFFAGYGLGTSYIAELHHDLGYVGVALGSIGYGFLLRWLYAKNGYNFWKFACGLLMLEEFAILPRYGADVIFRPFYNLTRLLVLGLLVALMWCTKDNIAKVKQKMMKSGIGTMLTKLKKMISTRSVMLHTPPMGDIRHITDEEVKELQKVMLQIIKDVAAVCDKHGICYMADGGTALGSVRHKGFIPWDDDVDLIMPRDDLNRFVEVFDRELGDKYELVTPNSKGHKVASLITEVYAKNTYKSSLHNMDNDLPQGVMIDIFPLEYAPLNPVVRKIKGLTAMLLQYIAVSATFYHLYNSPTKKAFFYQTKEGKFNYNFRRLIGFVFSFRSYEKWCNTFDRFVRGNKDTGLWCIPTDVGHYFGHLMPKDVFYPPIKGQFEDMEINLPHDIHAYLVNAYGDYMWIPPVEQREKHWTVGFCMDVAAAKEKGEAR